MALSPQAIPAWQERALDRSLEPARNRSVARLEKLVDAARQLAGETGAATFTVAQVAERAGVSIKSFYRSFAGKDELLLALIETDSRIGADLLAGAVARRKAPTDRLRAYVKGLFKLLTEPGASGYAGVLVREYHRLSEERPDELDAALISLTGLLEDEVRAADAAGAITTPDPARASATVFGMLLNGVHDVTIRGAEPLAVGAHLWKFCWGGLQGDAHG
jgi:AcrR family transcriptional regulator